MKQEGEMSGERREGLPGAPELERLDDGPRIYVASLADYNADYLHGRRIEAAQEPDALHESVQQMLVSSRMPLAEEWAIHDFEGFGEFRLHEYESMETVSRLALGIAEHGQAFVALASLVGTEASELERFEDCFLGQFESMEDFARGLAEDLGWEEELDRLADSFRSYVSIDYDMLGRDLETELSTAEAEDGGVYVFDLRT